MPSPVLAWLEALRNGSNQDVCADIHYCVRDRKGDPFVARLETLCAAAPGVRLHLHVSGEGSALTADALATAADDGRRAGIWFCGPSGLADKLHRDLTAMGQRVRLHREAFEMR